METCALCGEPIEPDDDTVTCHGVFPAAVEHADCHTDDLAIHDPALPTGARR